MAGRLRIVDPMRADHLKGRCSAHTKAGKECGYPPVPGATVCRFHGGSAPQVKDAAMRRILAFADPAAAILVDLAQNGSQESVRLAAVRDLLDRAGFGAKQKIEAEHTGAEGGPIRTESVRPDDVAAVLSILRANGVQEDSEASA